MLHKEPGLAYATASNQVSLTCIYTVFKESKDICSGVFVRWVRSPDHSGWISSQEKAYGPWWESSGLKEAHWFLMDVEISKSMPNSYTIIWKDSHDSRKSSHVSSGSTRHPHGVRSFVLTVLCHMTLIIHALVGSSNILHHNNNCLSCHPFCFISTPNPLLNPHLILHSYPNLVLSLSNLLSLSGGWHNLYLSWHNLYLSWTMLIFFLRECSGQLARTLTNLTR